MRNHFSKIRMTNCEAYYLKYFLNFFFMKRLQPITSREEFIELGVQKAEEKRLKKEAIPVISI